MNKQNNKLIKYPSQIYPTRSKEIHMPTKETGKLTPEEIEKLYNEFEKRIFENDKTGKVINLFDPLEFGKVVAEAQLAKLAAVPLDEKMRPLNPYHKTADYGRGEMSWAEEPEFTAFEEGVNATNALYQNAKEIQARKEIFQTYDEYIALLTDELTELAGIASVHGWITSRFEQGKICRTKIKALKGEA